MDPKGFGVWRADGEIVGVPVANGHVVVDYKSFPVPGIVDLHAKYSESVDLGVNEELLYVLGPLA